MSKQLADAILALEREVSDSLSQSEFDYGVNAGLQRAAELIVNTEPLKDLESRNDLLRKQNEQMYELQKKLAAVRAECDQWKLDGRGIAAAECVARILSIIDAG